jgi:hypothetical protein
MLNLKIFLGFDGLLHMLALSYDYFNNWLVFHWIFKKLIPPLFSYHYNFDTDAWNAVYKHTVGKNFKVKAGYDSEVQVVWTSLWVRTLQLLCSVISCGAIERMNLEISLLEQRI